MSVLIVSSMGHMVVDLFVDTCPMACENFVKLCKLKYYNNVLVYNVQKDYIMQTGDPTGTGDGGNSAKGVVSGAKYPVYFRDEVLGRGGRAARRHDRAGLLCMASSGRDDSNLSQFFLTLRGHDLQHLDGKHSIFGEVVEGMEVLELLNGAYCDGDGRPFQVFPP
jgi:peptidyl-prolyl cis-trans isomerase-like 4